MNTQTINSRNIKAILKEADIRVITNSRDLDITKTTAATHLIVTGDQKKVAETLRRNLNRAQIYSVSFVAGEAIPIEIQTLAASSLEVPVFVIPDEEQGRLLMAQLIASPLNTVLSALNGENVHSSFLTGCPS